MTRRLGLCALLLTLLMTLAGCSQDQSGSGGGSDATNTPAKAADLTILSGSENQTLEPLIQQYAKQHNVTIQMNYTGSVEIMRQLQAGQGTADAVWPANSFWISLGDDKHRVKRAASVMRTPVVFGVKKSVAARLGWVGKPVTVEQILLAAEAGKLKYLMTSATQSNSGASAYLGYLYAFAGRPDVLTAKNLADPKVRAFHRAAAPALAAAGLLQLVIVRLDRRIVAVLHGFADRNRWYSYINGVDHQTPGQSFGTLAFACMIEAAVAAGASEFNFLRGEEPYKYAWGAVPTHTTRRVVRKR